MKTMGIQESVRFCFWPLLDCLLCVEEAAEHGIKAAHIQQAVAQRQDHCSCSFLVLRGSAKRCLSCFLLNSDQLSNNAVFPQRFARWCLLRGCCFGCGAFFPQRLTKASPLIPNILSGFNAGAIRCFFSSPWGF